MSLSRIVKRRKYTSSKQKIDLFAGESPADVKSGLPPKIERPTVSSESLTVEDIFKSLRKSQQDARL